MTPITHGESHNHISRLYRIWTGMKTRTTNKKHLYYKYYGGKNIIVCAEWQDYVSFRDWSLANGYADNLTINRKESSGNYEPGNCEWITQERNNQNKTKKTDWGIIVTPWGYRVTIRRKKVTYNGGSTKDLNIARTYRDKLENYLRQKLV